ncbi:MAG: winged helix-turn-helix transcriptional regulator [Anaerolineales bacterium]|jgi:predicted transcriptional regulator
MSKNKWTFITNHAAVLTLLNRQEHLTSREIALALGITERSVIRIIKDLEADGYITKQKEGRKNRYTVNTDLPLRRNDQREVPVYDLIQLISRKG